MNNVNQIRLLQTNIEKRQRENHLYGVVLGCFLLCSVKTFQQGL